MGLMNRTSTNSIIKKVHMDTGALSLLITNYVFSLISVIIVNKEINIVKALLIAILAIINLISLVKVHLNLISKRRPRDYALFLINTAPYATLIMYQGLWLLIPILPLILFMVEVIRGRGRSVVANVSGTALIASTYIAWYVLMGGRLINSVIAMSMFWVMYHTFSALFVEGILPFRQGIMPRHASIFWLMALSLLIPTLWATMGSLSLLLIVEPTVRALVTFKEDKLSIVNLRGRIRRIGITLLTESLVLATLALMLLYLA